MQIDFHHGATYVVARLAGFTEADANIIAYSAQYVDDATNSGTIQFDNGGQYTRIASAHKMLAYQNLDALLAHQVWLPFHFLPGSLGRPPDAKFKAWPQAEYLMRCICMPNSHVAQQMMHDVIRRQERIYALQRLGIASHVFIDTWAHQGFVGYPHPVNRAHDIEADMPGYAQSLMAKIENKFAGLFDGVKSQFVADFLPLGHGAVLSFPDQPYLSWRYVNGLNLPIARDNPTDFLTALQALYQMYCRYRGYKEVGASIFEREFRLDDQPAQKLDDCIRGFTDPEGEDRHERWLEKIADGYFGFRDDVTYVGKGPGSWKHEAVGATGADEEDLYMYKPQFLTSNWKLFHDALQTHRLYVLNELLPMYGLTAA